MNVARMHSIDVQHDMREVGRSEFGASSQIATMRCENCGVESSTLHMISSDETPPEPESLDDKREFLKRMNRSMKRMRDAMEKYKCEILGRSKYPTIEALVHKIDKRYDGEIDGRGIPYRYLDPWATTNNSKAQRKILLLYRQGQVCNRCDRIFSYDDLTEDHIEGDRNRGRLTDLQLLCKKCNEEKGVRPPGDLDVSPFRFVGKTCVHRVTCTELATMLTSQF